MRITYERDKNRLIIGEVVFSVSNNVRNEIDPKNVRRLHVASEVRHVVTVNHTVGDPYMPRKFPKGTWAVTAVEWQKDQGFNKQEFGLVRIRTNAYQKVETWTLDAKGGYDKPSGKYVDDYGYLFHYSDFKTTLGCGRFDSQESAIKAAKLIADALRNGNVILEVV